MPDTIKVADAALVIAPNAARHREALTRMEGTQVRKIQVVMPNAGRVGSDLHTSGDVAGQKFGGFWNGPDGTVNIKNAQAAILVFQASEIVPSSTWTDLGPQETNLITNIDDVFYIILGFQGEPYPWVSPSECP